MRARSSFRIAAFLAAAAVTMGLSASCGPNGGASDPDRGSSADAARDARGSLDVAAEDAADSEVPTGPGDPCPPSDVIDATTFPWKPPYTKPASCTSEELDALVAFVDKTDDPQKWKDGDWTTNEGCRDCVFARRRSGRR